MELPLYLNEWNFYINYIRGYYAFNTNVILCTHYFFCPINFLCHQLQASAPVTACCAIITPEGTPTRGSPSAWPPQS